MKLIGPYKTDSSALEPMILRLLTQDGFSSITRRESKVPKHMSIHTFGDAVFKPDTYKYFKCFRKEREEIEFATCLEHFRGQYFSINLYSQNEQSAKVLICSVTIINSNEEGLYLDIQPVYPEDWDNLDDLKNFVTCLNWFISEFIEKLKF